MRSSIVRSVVVIIGVFSALTVTGCCEIQKQPGRCAACCYDSCIIPTVGTGTAAMPMATDARPKKGHARPMAF